VWPHTLVPLGDRALTIDLATVEGGAVRALIHSLEARIRHEAPAGVTALVPAIRTLTLHYEPLDTTYDALRNYIEVTLGALVVAAAPPREPIVIPVCYGGDYGPDLDAVAATHGTTAESVVALHTAGVYTVAMIGFLPGFPYLEGLATGLHTPRRAVPRTHVPAGSIGIGGSSTGVYPCASPGGWHLIGRTPRALFDPLRVPPALLQPGDRVRFVAIAPGEWATHADAS
jgi:inhibitor of KinA